MRTFMTADMLDHVKKLYFKNMKVNNLGNKFYCVYLYILSDFTELNVEIVYRMLSQIFILCFLGTFKTVADQAVCVDGC